MATADRENLDEDAAGSDRRKDGEPSKVGRKGRRRRPAKGSAAPPAPKANTVPVARMPRWSLGALDLLCAALFGLAARFLPWDHFTVFAIAAGIMALVHAARAALALTRSPLLPPVMRAGAFISLAFLAWLTFELVSTAAYVSQLYGTLGDGVAAAAAAVWAVAALFTLPVAIWAIALTGGLKLKSAATGAVAAMMVLPLLGGAYQSQVAAGEMTKTEAWHVEAVDAVMRDVAAATRRLDSPDLQVSLFTSAPVECAKAPSPDVVTAAVTFLAPGTKRAKGRTQPRAVTRCVQSASVKALGEDIKRLLADESSGGRVKVDAVLVQQAIPDLGPFLGMIALRPGLDGACVEARCLMPWQLVALDQFRKFSKISEIQLKFGATAEALRLAITGDGENARWVGITRIETRSFLIDDRGELRVLRRMREPAPDLTAERLTRATDQALKFILGVQEKDGRFGYLVDPFEGTVSYSNFSVARQAGTTLALCELGAADEVRAGAQRSLQMLSTLERKSGQLGALVYPRGSRNPASLGATALSMIAFVACRPVVGDRNDAIIARMGRFLLAMQRDDGGFHPRFEFQSSAPIPGTDPMYAEGQVIMALVLWEGVAAESLAEPRPEALAPSIERAMDHFSGPYWDTFTRDFFFLEENWHCLAARAALPHHRHDAYERFCIDYVTMKERLTFDQDSHVAEELVGAYGFGNVLPPHNTATAGYGEALAAKMAILEARGASVDSERESMRLTLRFLLSQQWTDDNCFACSTRRRIPGGFSEHVGSPEIRIDYVQHALAAMGHGGRMLGLLPSPGA